MKLVLTLTSLSILSIAQVSGQETFSGEATTYGGNANGGTCGFQRSWRAWSFNSVKFTAALNTPQWDSSLNCGRCAKVQHQNNPPIIVQIVDKCPECKHGDLDFAPEAYAAITKKGPGREHIIWSWVECPPDFVQGNFEIVLKEGSNPYWVAFQPQNFKVGVKKLEIRMEGQQNWKPLERNDHVLPGYYFQAANVHGGFELRATAVNGQVIESRKFGSINEAMLTHTNFAGGAGGNPQSEPQPQSQPQSQVQSQSQTNPPPKATPKPNDGVTPQIYTIKSAEVPVQKVYPVPENKSPAMTPAVDDKHSQC